MTHTSFTFTWPTCIAARTPIPHIRPYAWATQPKHMHAAAGVSEQSGPAEAYIRFLPGTLNQLLPLPYGTDWNGSLLSNQIYPCNALSQVLMHAAVEGFIGDSRIRASSARASSSAMSIQTAHNPSFNGSPASHRTEGPRKVHSLMHRASLSYRLRPPGRVQPVSQRPWPTDTDHHVATL